MTTLIVLGVVAWAFLLVTAGVEWTVRRLREEPPGYTDRSRRFTGPLADQEAEAWQPDPRCFSHLRSARRAEVGLGEAVERSECA